MLVLPGTQQLFDEVLSENWNGLEAETNIDQPRLDKKLKQFYDRLQEEENMQLDETDQHPAGFFGRKTYLRFAAILAACIIGFGAYTLLQFKKTPLQEQLAVHEVVNPFGQRSKVVLPDSSEVFLGAGSKLRFPDRFTAKTREISLEGEAFFQVTKNPHKPFIIHTGTVQTKVLGTSFRIEAFKGSPLNVSVATGKVRVDDYARNQVKSLAVLLPGQKVSYTSARVILGQADIDEVRNWKDGKLVFRKASLKEITATLERWYNVKFDYRNSLKSKEEISVVLQGNEPLGKLMKVLGATGHFKYHIDADHVYIH